MNYFVDPYALCAITLSDYDTKFTDDSKEQLQVRGLPGEGASIKCVRVEGVTLYSKADIVIKHSIVFARSWHFRSFRSFGLGGILSGFRVGLSVLFY